MSAFLRWLAFNLWYYRRPPWDTGVSPPELFAFLDSYSPGRALDLGCGTGTNAITLAQHDWSVIGVDFAVAAVRRARRKARAAGVAIEFHVGDVTRLEFVRQPVNLVLDIGCYHGLSPAGRERYRRRVCDLLAPGGCLLLYAHLSRDPAVSGRGINEDDLEQFARLLRLESRQDSRDRFDNPAVWLTYAKVAGG